MGLLGAEYREVVHRLAQRPLGRLYREWASGPIGVSGQLERGEHIKSVLNQLTERVGEVLNGKQAFNCLRRVLNRKGFRTRRRGWYEDKGTTITSSAKSHRRPLVFAIFMVAFETLYPRGRRVLYVVGRSR